jgi:hypothetical protein
MKKVLSMPLLGAVLFGAACGRDGPTANETTARVRFFNATTGLTASGGFTTNGQFATGSALAFGQSAQTCATVNVGSTSFGFGEANTSGTGLSGVAISTLNNQTVAGGGDYTMVAAGSAASPQLYLLDNNFSGSVGANRAIVRFVNLAPGPEALPNIFYVFTSWPPVEAGSLFEASLLVGSPTVFRNVASGSTEFSIIIGHQIETLNTISVNLQSGSVNTIAIVPNPSGGHQLINIPRC